VQGEPTTFSLWLKWVVSIIVKAVFISDYTRGTIKLLEIKKEILLMINSCTLVAC
jgi:hypothetical protein